MDVDDLMSDLDSKDTPINNPDEAREVTQSLVHTLALLALSSKEKSLQTTASTDIQPTSKINTKEPPGEATEGGITSQDVTPIPTRATISAEQIKRATVSLFSFIPLSLMRTASSLSLALKSAGKKGKTERLALERYFNSNEQMSSHSYGIFV